MVLTPIALILLAGRPLGVAPTAKGVPSIHRPGARGSQELLLALKQGEAATAASLIAQGADPDSTDVEGFSALHSSITQRLDKVALLLIQKGANVSYDFMGSSTLQLAMVSNCQANPSGRKVMEALTSHGAQFTDQDQALFTLSKLRPERGWTSLEDGYLKAIQQGDLRLLELFVIHFQDVNKPFAGKLGFRPLHFAAMYGNADSVRFLVAHGADVNARAKNGMPILFAAKDHPEIERLLKGLGAKAEP